MPVSATAMRRWVNESPFSKIEALTEIFPPGDVNLMAFDIRLFTMRST